MKLRCFASLAHRVGRLLDLFAFARRFNARILEMDGMQVSKDAGTAAAVLFVPDDQVEKFKKAWSAKFSHSKPSMHTSRRGRTARVSLASHRIVAFGADIEDFSYKVLGIISHARINLTSAWHKQFTDAIGPLPDAEKLVVYADLSEAQVRHLNERFAIVFAHELAKCFFRIHHMCELTGRILQFGHSKSMQLQHRGGHEVEHRTVVIPAWNRAGLALEVEEIASRHNCHVEVMDGLRRNHGTATIIVELSGLRHDLDAFWRAVGRLPAHEVPVTTYHAELVHNDLRTSEASHLLTVKARDASTLRLTLRHVRDELGLDIARLWYASGSLDDHHYLVQVFFDNFEIDHARLHQLIRKVEKWANHHEFAARFCVVQTHDGNTEAQAEHTPRNRKAA